MIRGIGTDLIEISRIDRLSQKFGARFYSRLFTPQEQMSSPASSSKRAAYYAKRFAAKEACLKALGTGYRGALKWHDMEITNDSLGAPVLTLKGQALVLAQGRLAPFEVLKVHLSLADTKAYAQAFVILEGIKSA